MIPAPFFLTNNSGGLKFFCRDVGGTTCTIDPGSIVCQIPFLSSLPSWFALVLAHILFHPRLSWFLAWISKNKTSPACIVCVGDVGCLCVDGRLFDCDFESGNIGEVKPVSEFEFDLASTCIPLLSLFSIIWYFYCCFRHSILSPLQCSMCNCVACVLFDSYPLGSSSSSHPFILPHS